MFRVTIALFAMLCHTSFPALAAAQTVKPLPTIQVTAPKDAAAVEELNDALAHFSEKVTVCVKTGQKPETCRCSVPRDLTNLRKTYANLIRQHPDWKDQLLSYHRLDKDGRNISGTLFLENLRRQLEVLKCE